MFKTRDNRLLSISQPTWDEVSKLLGIHHPELVQTMVELGLDKEPLFFLADYPFGTDIIYNKVAYIPLADGGSISLNDPSLPPAIHEHLSYQPETGSPVGMVVSKTAESYLYVGNKISPYKLIRPGDFLGLSGILNNETDETSSALMWNLVAGARSTFILTKISENNSHNNLKRIYGITSEKPTDYNQQWPALKELAKNAHSLWRQSILFFSNKLLVLLKDARYAPLNSQLAAIHRSSYNLWHNKILKWEVEFHQMLHDAGLTEYSTHTLNIVSHLLMIARGSALGFAPTTDDSQSPHILFKEIYANDYVFNTYCLTMMQAAKFPTMDGDGSVYYSPWFPILAKNIPETFKGKSNRTLWVQVQYVLNRLQQYILVNFKDKTSDLYKAALAAKFAFYHFNPGEYKTIKNSLLLAEEDPRFIHNLSGVFPAHSIFTRCCVKITPVTRD